MHSDGKYPRGVVDNALVRRQRKRELIRKIEHLQPAVGRYTFQYRTPNHKTELAIQLRSEELCSAGHRDLAHSTCGQPGTRSVLKSKLPTYRHYPLAVYYTVADWVPPSSGPLCTPLPRHPIGVTVASLVASLWPSQNKQTPLPKHNN